MKFKNPASRFALVGVFVADFDGAVRVAVTGAAPAVFRASAYEEALSNRFDVSALDGLEIDAANLASDMHAQADYRAHLIGVLTRRAVEEMSHEHA